MSAQTINWVWDSATVLAYRQPEGVYKMWKAHRGWKLLLLRGPSSSRTQVYRTKMEANAAAHRLCAEAEKAREWGMKFQERAW